MFDVGCVKPADLPSLIYFVLETYGSKKNDEVNCDFEASLFIF